MPDDADDRPPTPPGAVEGRAWHRIAISGIVGVLVAAGALLGYLGVVDAVAGGGGAGAAAMLAGSSLCWGVAASMGAMLVMH